MFADIAAPCFSCGTDSAAKLGLNQATFDQCLDSNKQQARVREGAAQGEALGVNSTPSIYINGRPLIGAQPFEVFKQAIDEELAKAGQK